MNKPANYMLNRRLRARRAANASADPHGSGGVETTVQSGKSQKIKFPTKMAGFIRTVKAGEKDVKFFGMEVKPAKAPAMRPEPPKLRTVSEGAKFFKIKADV